VNLTPHFTLDELTVTQHRGVDNTPPTLTVMANLRRTAMLLEQVRTRLGVPVLVSSGYRCAELNTAVGGQANSQHLTGQAADFIAPAFGGPVAVASALRDTVGLDYDQLILEFDRWVHISWADRPRHHALIIDKTGTRPMWG
jgi:zinc D-Ala-D-Ala carboxypeptidase